MPVSQLAKRPVPEVPLRQNFDFNTLETPMKAGRFTNPWTLAALFLVVVIIASGAVIWSKRDRTPPVEISLVPAPAIEATLYVGGAVITPGYYPLRAGDTLPDLLAAAGGPAAGAGLDDIELMVSP